MERQGFDIPLLLGGATTSRAHTAVKVDGQYHGPVVWVKDASRSVPVVSQLLSDGQRGAFLDGITKDYDAIRVRHAAKSGERPLASYEQAGANRPVLDWASYRPKRPHLLEQQSRDRWSGPPDAHWHRAATQFTRVWEDFPVGRAAALHRLDPVLPRLGDQGPLPRRAQQRRDVGAGAQAVRRRQRHARPDRARALAHRSRRRRHLPGQRGRRRHRGLRRRGAQHGAHDAARPATAGAAPRRRRQQVPVRLRRTQGDRDRRPRRRVLGHGGARPRGAPRRPSRTTSTTTRRSCSRPWPTGSPRRSPSACTRRCAASCGATPPTSTSTWTS